MTCLLTLTILQVSFSFSNDREILRNYIVFRQLWYLLEILLYISNLDKGA